jgi:hypothetical protein
MHVRVWRWPGAQRLKCAAPLPNRPKRCAITGVGTSELLCLCLSVSSVIALRIPQPEATGGNRKSCALSAPRANGMVFSRSDQQPEC